MSAIAVEVFFQAFSLRAFVVVISFLPKKRVGGSVGDRGKAHMAKLKRIALWSVILGIALVTQACWDDDPKGFKLVGEGACRQADGGAGNPRYAKAASLDECFSQCLQDSSSCKAIEYNSKNGSCEIHSEPISKFEKVEGVSCYTVE
jgi:PAN domain